MTKITGKPKRNRAAQDTTLINLRVLKTLIEDLKKRVEKLEKAQP